MPLICIYIEPLSLYFVSFFLFLYRLYVLFLFLTYHQISEILYWDFISYFIYLFFYLSVGIKWKMNLLVGKHLYWISYHLYLFEKISNLAFQYSFVVQWHINWGIKSSIFVSPTLLSKITNMALNFIFLYKLEYCILVYLI